MKLMTTPYRFSPDVVREVVEPGRPGSYLLGFDDGEFRAAYAGRSDMCLLTRLATHNHLYDYDYFIFRYSRDEMEAYRQECESWHILRVQGGDVGNRIHPAAPAGSGASCPYCHFSRHMEYLLAA